MDELRNTPYARELCRASVQVTPNDEVRIERLYIKDLQRAEIRFSWWPNGRLAQKPLDVSEDELLQLFQEAIREEVFSEKFLKELKTLLDQQ